MKRQSDNQQTVHQGRQLPYNRTRPVQGKLKVNCDASVRGNGFVSLGFGVRDDRGGIVALGVDRCQCNILVTDAEVMAIRSGLQLARGLDAEDIDIESDCSPVLNALIFRKDIPSDIHAIVMDCVGLCNRFKGMDFLFI